MNKSDLISAVAKNIGITKKAAEGFLNSTIEAVKAELKKGGSVQLIGFGSFKVGKRSARKVRNPKTGKEMNIPAKKYPKFAAGKSFKETVK